MRTPEKLSILKKKYKVGMLLNQEMVADLYPFNRDTVAECTVAHSATWTGILTQYRSYEVGQTETIRWIFFKKESYKNWKLIEIKK